MIAFFFKMGMTTGALVEKSLQDDYYEQLKNTWLACTIIQLFFKFYCVYPHETSMYI